MKAAVAGVALVVLVAAGCGGGTSQATRDARHVSAMWRSELRKRAREAPRQRFDNLSPQVLRRRLEAAARRYDFEVVSFRLLRPRQLAPRIVVRTRHDVELAHAVPRILRRLDPKAGTGDDRTGWRYEGFWFEADDEHGDPLLAVFNFWRGPHAGGGQWARSDRLYPFSHG